MTFVYDINLHIVVFVYVTFVYDVNFHIVLSLQVTSLYDACTFRSAILRTGI